MTVSVSNRLSQLYVGNNVNTRFDFTFRVFDQEDVNGISIRLKNSTGFETVDTALYTVTINEDNLGGHVDFLTPPSILSFFYVVGDTPTDQLLDITNYDNFYPDAIERALDKLTAILQEWSTRLTQETENRQFKDIELEQFIKDYVASVLSINSPEAITTVLADIVQTNVLGTEYNQQEFNEFLVEFVNNRYPDVNDFIEQSQNAFDTFVSTNQTVIDNTVSQAQTDVSTAIAGIQPTVDAAVSNAGNMIGAANKAALDLITDKPVNQNAMLDNGDIYRWNGTIWVPTGLNYLNASLEERRTIESNRPQNPNKFTFDQVNFTTAPTATVGTVTYPFRNGIKQIKLVSTSTGSPITVYWEFPISQFTREFSASVTVEGLTSGSNGVVGIEQRNDANTIISSNYAATAVTAAVTKQTYKVNISGVSVGATKIRLTVNMLTTGTREMYVHSPFIADGTNAEFIAPVRDPSTADLILSVNKLNASFDTVAVSNKNRYNPALAANGQLVSYSTGANVAFADGIAFGKLPVVAGTTYTFSIQTSASFAFFPVIYTYSSGGSFLGLDHSIPSSGEVVNPNPPTGIVYSDSNKTVTFTIPSGSSIAFIQLRSENKSHTPDEFTSLVNAMQLETGIIKTSFEPYNPSGDSTKLVLKDSSLPSGATSGGGALRNTFTVATDGNDAYVRTSYSTSLDLVQKVRYGTNETWKNNIINPWEVRTIPKNTAKDATISAFSTGNLLIAQGDDAAPLHYNGTYIGANHGAFVVHEVTATGHGKSFADVGSRWTQGANTFTIVRIVDANKLWLVSQNVGTTYWQFVTSSLNGLTLTHSTGAVNTASFTPSADTQTQLMSALNNHTKRIVADGFRDITAFNAVYDVQSVEFIDNYDIMNPSSILSYLQARTGTTTEQSLSNNSIASDMRVSVNYRYSFNGTSVVSTQLVSKAALNFTFAGFTQAMVANFIGKTLLQYVNKVGPIAGPSKTWNFANIEDITTTIDSIDFLKANWTDALNPPDRMAQIVKNGSTKEFGHVVGYSLSRGISKPNVRQATNNAGFVYTSRKMYPKANTANIYASQPNGLMPAGTVLNEVSYRSVYSSEVLPSATVYTWYEDNDDIYVVLDMHQSASMLTLPLPDAFNGKSASVVDANADFTLHSEIVSDGGLLCSVINGYGQATIKLS